MTPDLYLDGNALGGVLYEVFGREMTADEGTCLDCGHVLRCPDCGAVLLVIVVEPDGYHVTVESLQAPGL